MKRIILSFALVALFGNINAQTSKVKPSGLKDPKVNISAPVKAQQMPAGSVPPPPPPPPNGSVPPPPPPPPNMQNPNMPPMPPRDMAMPPQGMDPRNPMNGQAPGMPPQGAPGRSLPPAAAADPALLEKKIKLNEEIHDFGTVPEGGPINTDFILKNTSKDTIQLNHVQASCGCTQPQFKAGPIAPGASTTIKAIYNTDGRPNGFDKTLTVQTNFGNKILRIRGNVTAKATPAAPAAAPSQTAPPQKK